MSQETNYLKEALNDKVLKWFLRVIGLFLVIYTGVFVYKAIAGKHVNLFGMEMNAEEEKTDTVYLQPPMVAKYADSTVKEEPVELRKPKQSASFASLPIRKSKLASTKDTGVVKNDPAPQSVPQAKYHVENPVNSAVGDNATVNNYGKQPTLVDRRLVLDIQSSFPDKTKKISLYYPAYSADSKGFCDQLRTLLKETGYQNVGIGVSMFAGSPPQGIHVRKKTEEELELVVVTE